MLGWISCIINTIFVVLMAYDIVLFEHPINFLWLLIAVAALLGQWILTVRHRTRNND